MNKALLLRKGKTTVILLLSTFDLQRQTATFFIPSADCSAARLLDLAFFGSTSSLTCFDLRLPSSLFSNRKPSCQFHDHRSDVHPSSGSHNSHNVTKSSTKVTVNGDSRLPTRVVSTTLQSDENDEYRDEVWKICEACCGVKMKERLLRGKFMVIFQREGRRFFWLTYYDCNVVVQMRFTLGFVWFISAELTYGVCFRCCRMQAKEEEHET
ncbi:unnamed protein product [Vicia faba]|uniref:Transmembrane protein n=1 Tax=Vicia faba TaxID=3906 RepID=A0AAV0Z115_VICFA|nr:unnamed protein product [Vicia faba]